MTRTVLFVDDEPNVLQMIVEALEDEPYEVLTAESAEEALELLAGDEIDVVVSDEIMPGMSGTEFLQVVRDEYPDTIRMILTAYPVLKKAMRAIEDGSIYHFFSKPFNIVDLAVNIRQAFRQKEILAEGRHMLELVKKQSAILREIGSKCPALVKLAEDGSGTMIIDDAGVIDWEKVKRAIAEIEEEARSGEVFFEDAFHGSPRRG